MLRSRCVLLFILSWICSLAPILAPHVKGAEQKQMFPSKNIRFIVPVSPGGIADTDARILAPFLKKYLPGQPNVIVKNVPGAEWRLGIMEMYRARPDGNTICIFISPGAQLGQIIERVEYDVNEIGWIQTLHDTPDYLTVLSAKSKFRTLRDLQSAPIVRVGVVGLTSATTIGVVISAEKMGYKIRLVKHNSNAEAVFSAIRGDVDLVTYGYTSTLKKFLEDSKDLIPLLVCGKERLKELPNTPTAGEWGYKELADVVAGDFIVGTTPGTSGNILKIWRDVFDKTMLDPEYRGMMEKTLSRPIHPINGEQTAQKVKEQLMTYSRYKDLIMQYISK